MNEMASERARDFILGLDLGRSQDYTALTILERRWVKDGTRQVKHYNLRHLKRWPLKTSYPEIVEEVCNLVQTAPLHWPLLAADQTGVGVAIVDMFRHVRVKAKLNPIVITGGHEITRPDAAWRVPKKELVHDTQKPCGQGI